MSDSFKKTNITLIFYQFKESPYYSFTLFFFVFLTALSLLLFAVVPQVQSLFTLNDEIAESRNKVTILKNNAQFLNSLNTQKLSDDLQITFDALPSEKDFVGIISAINNSAAISGVELDTYNLAIGELATPSAGLEAFFPLSVDVVVNGDEASVTKFLSTTQEALPLSEIDSIQLEDNEQGSIIASIKIIFFFKVYKNENYSVATPILFVEYSH